ncbi:MAG: anti-sigma factor [Candidatus Thiodiazotropha sp.]
MIRESDQAVDSHLLAGEYVLGTLQGEGRRDFERELRRDFSLQAEVEAWERRLSYMLDDIEPVDPPRKLWRLIERRINEPSRNPLAGCWNSLQFWRGLGMVAATIVLGLSLYRVQGGDPEIDKMMVVTNRLEQPGWVVTNHGGNDYLRVSAIESDTIPQGNYCQLWMENSEGRMVPIGVLPHRGSETVPLSAKIQATTRFKVSIESRRRAPLVSPSSRVIFEGRMRDI